MNRLLIHNARLFTPEREFYPGWLLAGEGRIQALGAGQPPVFEAPETVDLIDARGANLLPGFVDLHVHGAVGHEVMDASAPGLAAMARFYAAHGVTGFLATTWTASHEAILTALETIAGQAGPAGGGAAVLGAHLEGPYLNPARCGAQDARLIRRANLDEARQYLETGLVRLVAVAPEFPENLALVDECVRRGVAVSAGHTAASFEEMEEAVRRGVRQVTHCYNAMTPLSHRQPGTVGAALALPEIKCELIADNIHIHPAVMRLTRRAKGPDGVLLVTDAIRAAGLPDGDYPIDTRTVTVRDGAVRLPDGALAGSILTMDAALRNFLAASRLPLSEIWPAASLVPARQIGLAHRKGSLEAGKDADLVLLDGSLNVALTAVMGRVVYRA